MRCIEFQTIALRASQNWLPIFQPDESYDPTVTTTLYSVTIGGFLTGLSAFGTNQAVIQRALGTKTLSRAQWSYVMSGPLLCITQFVAVVVGWVLFAYYASTCCDPITHAPEVEGRSDKVLPYFIMEVLNYPTVPGFFFGSVICGSLSTISSSINSVSAVVWDDVFARYCRCGRLPELGQAVVRRIISIIFGGLIIGAAFLLNEYKSNSTLVAIVFSVFGALQGPVLAMFFFAALVPFSSGVGTLLGGLVAVGVNLWIIYGRTVTESISFHLLPYPTGGCGVTNATCSPSFTDASPDVDWFGDLDWVFAISFWYYPLISIVIVFVLGTLASIPFWCEGATRTKKKYLFPLIRFCAGVNDDESEEEVVEEVEDDIDEALMAKY